MTQVNPLSPTIFNMVVDAVVQHWVTLEIEGTDKRGGRKKEGRHQSTLFYADSGMVVSSNPCWLQWAFNALVSLFEHMGLRTNVGKTVCEDTRVPKDVTHNLMSPTSRSNKSINLTTTL